MPSIRASVGPTMIEKSTRFFNASFEDIFAELFQNARRAGATSISVDLRDISSPAYPYGVLVVYDDGCGVADPAALVTLGQSSWPDTTCIAEDPAGMGLFALSSRQIRVSSCLEGGQGWRMSIGENQWLGRTDIPVETYCRGRGTTFEIALSQTDKSDMIMAAATRSARFLPVEVRFTDFAGATSVLPYSLFGAGFVHEVIRDGVAYRVVPGKRISRTHGINFHGVTCEFVAAQISCLDGQQFHVLIDVLVQPALALVLPARRDVVQTPYLETVYANARFALFSYFATQDSHRLPYYAWVQAKEAGVVLPEASQMLRPWTPSSENPSHSVLGAYLPIAGTPAIVANLAWDGEDAASDQSLARAFAIEGAKLPLYEADSQLVGYSWYDGLPRLSSVDAVITPSPCDSVDALRVDSITLTLTTESAGNKSYRQLSSDLWMAPSEYCSGLDDLRLFVTHDSKISVETLASLMVEAAWCPDEDSDSDSFSTQLARAERLADSRAAGLLLSAEATALRELEQLFKRFSLKSFVPVGMRAVVSFDNASVDIQLHPQTGANADLETATPSSAV